MSWGLEGPQAQPTVPLLSSWLLLGLAEFDPEPRWLLPVNVNITQGIRSVPQLSAHYMGALKWP